MDFYVEMKFKVISAEYILEETGRNTSAAVFCALASIPMMFCV